MDRSLNDCIKEYKNQLKIGNVQKAYKKIIRYMMRLRNHFANKYSDDYQIGHFYQGYMDVTYFTFTPISLKNKKLKIAIGFIHEKMQFGIWLGGQNKQIQKEYWEIFKDSDWNKYRIPSDLDESFTIVENVLVDIPDFSNLDLLTEQIEIDAMTFILDIDEVLS